MDRLTPAVRESMEILGPLLPAAVALVKGEAPPDGINDPSWTARFGKGAEMNLEGESFEPQILAFCCYYCAYAAADLAGTMRLQYPPNVKILLVPCTGKVDELYLLRAFEQGADGVYVAGCLINQCHYLEGNLWATKRVQYVRGLLDEIGLGGERLEMYYLSSAEGGRFAEIANEMTERIRRLGPNPLRGRIGVGDEDQEQDAPKPGGDLRRHPGLDGRHG